MRCKQCDYPLWNLRSRQCPECGRDFRPSEHEFILNSVRFCCPHCNQDYYGTGAKGHLIPAEFDCVSCHAHIHMDQMVLLPTQGVLEEQTVADTMPWLDPRASGLKRITAFFTTGFRALFEPQRLARAMPAEPAFGRALIFAFLCTTLSSLIGFVPLLIFPLMIGIAMAGGAGGPGGMGGGPAALGMLTGMLMFLAGTALVVLSLLLLWILSAHAILRLTGPVRGSMALTAEPLCYGAAANVVSAVPCLGFYIAWIGWIWWSIVAIIMLRHRQAVSATRASIAVLALPVALFTIGAATIIVFLVPFIRQAQATTQMAPVPPGQVSAATLMQSRQVATALYSFRNRQNDWPRHAIELVHHNDMLVQNLILPGSSRTLDDSFVGPMSLQNFTLLPAQREQLLVQSAANSMPQDTIAHRLGDYIFTYHGLPDNPDPRLWLAVADPASPTSPAKTSIIILRADQTPRAVPASLFPGELEAQNQLRESLNLPPLPDPLNIQENQPATSSGD